VKQVTQFEAFDGKRFESEAECQAHETDPAHMRLVGLTIEQVKAAIARTDVELANAIEIVAAKIGLTRATKTGGAASPRNFGSRSNSLSLPPRRTTTAFSAKLRSSRMFPGHG